jgi:hypothetical protein
MRIRLLYILLITSLLGCKSDEPSAEALQLESAFAGSLQLNLTGDITASIPVDRSISLLFSTALDPATTAKGIKLLAGTQEITKTVSLSAQGKSALLSVNGILENNTVYTVSLTDELRSADGATITPTSFQFRTQAGELELVSVLMNGEPISNNPRVQNVDPQLTLTFEFSTPINVSTFETAFRLQGKSVNIVSSNEDKTITVTPTTSLDYIKKYNFSISDDLESAEGRGFDGYSLEFYTKLDPSFKFPQISDEDLLTKVQEQTFKYFWDFAHPNSGLARERNSSGNTVSISS